MRRLLRKRMPAVHLCQRCGVPLGGLGFVLPAVVHRSGCATADPSGTCHGIRLGPTTSQKYRESARPLALLLGIVRVDESVFERLSPYKLEGSWLKELEPTHEACLAFFALGLEHVNLALYERAKYLAREQRKRAKVAQLQPKTAELLWGPK